MIEVVMRPPEVFVRPLGHGEAVALKRRSKQAKHFSTRDRASILLASNTRMSSAGIAATTGSPTISSTRSAGAVTLVATDSVAVPRALAGSAKRRALSADFQVGSATTSSVSA